MINSTKLDPIKARVWAAKIKGVTSGLSASSTKAVDHHEHATRHDKEAAKRTCAVPLRPTRTNFVHLPLRNTSAQSRLRYDRPQL